MPAPNEISVLQLSWQGGGERGKGGREEGARGEGGKQCWRSGVIAAILVQALMAAQGHRAAGSSCAELQMEGGWAGEEKNR